MIHADCYPCLFQQISDLSSLMTLNEDGKRKLYNSVMETLIETRGEGLLVQHMVRSATDRAVKLSGRPEGYDPYSSIKKESNALALENYGRFKEIVARSAAPLETAVKLAAAGNIIDFGALSHRELDIEKELSVMEHQGFGIYHFETWEEKLASAKQLLYLCDNTGEIVLDRILVETIRETHPDIEIICAFRESPIINDALVTDGIAVGLDRTAELISSGSVYPGTVLPECTGKFKALFDKADMVISKGQGNFETLLGCPKEDLFFILKIKCPLMADLSGASEGDLVLMKNRKG